MTTRTWSKTALVIEAALESLHDMRYSTRYSDLGESQKSIEKDNALQRIEELLREAI